MNSISRGYGGTEVRWSEFGGTEVRWCENTLSARARAPTQSTNPKPRQPHVGADSRVCPPVPKPQTSHRNTGRHGGLPLHWENTPVAQREGALNSISRWYGGTEVRWCENTLSARARAPTQSTNPKPRPPRVGADSRVCPHNARGKPTSPSRRRFR